MPELGAIRESTWGKAVLVLGSVKPEWSSHLAHQRYEWRYYLAGSVWAQPLHLLSPRRYYPRNYLSGSGMTRFRDTEAAARAADFIVTSDRVESDALLTPGNQRVFLYDATGIDDLLELYRATYQRVVSGEPAARDHFDVYLDDGVMYHVKEPCVPEDVGRVVFMNVVPDRFERFKGPFHRSGVVFEGKCMAILPLPDYPVSGIRTGQKGTRRWELETGYRRWEVEIGSLRRPEAPAP